MTKSKCDCCGKEDKFLNQLSPNYASDNIAEVCNECLGKLNKLLDSCLKAQVIQRTNFIRDFIQTLKKSFSKP